VAKEEAGRYEVVITSSAEIHFYELAEYLYEHLSLERAEEVTSELSKMTLSLGLLYHRGSVERKLIRGKKSYRYILYKRTSRASVKIIYYVDEKRKTVYVTDFFPTEKDPRKIVSRNR
jgi:plasmid stabilization system protein ParE